MAEYTIRERQLPAYFLQKGSPELLFRKWQAYDEFDGTKAFETKDSRKPFLQNVIRLVENARTYYITWFSRYDAALTTGLQATSITLHSQWRLLVGYGVNPTLESGIMLHHLYGFPCIPGTEVKGLLHHVAEMQLMEKNYGTPEQKWQALEEIPRITKTLLTEGLATLLAFLTDLRRIRALFGSIHLEQGKRKIKDPETQREREIPTGPETPKSLLEPLYIKLKSAEAARASEPWKGIYAVLQELFDSHTGGVLRFYDAIPGEDQTNLLELDVLTPHYPDYYKDEDGKISPSDDQSPNPVLFLAVRPGIKFHFYYRSELARISRFNDDEAKAIKQVLGEGAEAEEKINREVESWLKTALSEWGIGAKTTAGYGYFSENLPTPPTFSAREAQMEKRPAAGPSGQPPRAGKGKPRKDKPGEIDLPSSSKTTPPGNIRQGMKLKAKVVSVSAQKVEVELLEKDAGQRVLVEKPYSPALNVGDTVRINIQEVGDKDKIRSAKFHEKIA